MNVSLFITCFNDTLFPRTGQATVELLERLGHHVDFRPAQSCCGQMHLNSGYPAQALALVRRFARVFADEPVIVVPSTSCTATIRTQFPRLASADPALARMLATIVPRVFELSEFLTQVLRLAAALSAAGVSSAGCGSGWIMGWQGGTLRVCAVQHGVGRMRGGQG